MHERQLSVPDIVLIAGTRVALGIGIGLLISERFNPDQRKAAGCALVGVGAITTIPILMNVVKKKAGIAGIDTKQAA